MQIVATHETGRINNGDLSYNIQMAQDATGVWWQRHIYLRAPRLTAAQETAWIISGTGRIGPSANMRKVA
jgi:hypothetical protein